MRLRTLGHTGIMTSSTASTRSPRPVLISAYSTSPTGLPPSGTRSCDVDRTAPGPPPDSRCPLAKYPHAKSSFAPFGHRHPCGRSHCCGVTVRCRDRFG